MINDPIILELQSETGELVEVFPDALAKCAHAIELFFDAVNSDLGQDVFLRLAMVGARRGSLHIEFKAHFEWKSSGGTKRNDGSTGTRYPRLLTLLSGAADAVQIGEALVPIAFFVLAFVLGQPKHVPEDLVEEVRTLAESGTPGRRASTVASSAAALGAASVAIQIPDREAITLSSPNLAQTGLLASAPQSRVAVGGTDMAGTFDVKSGPLMVRHNGRELPAYVASLTNGRQEHNVVILWGPAKPFSQQGKIEARYTAVDPSAVETLGIPPLEFRRTDSVLLIQKVRDWVE